MNNAHVALKVINTSDSIRAVFLRFSPSKLSSDCEEEQPIFNFECCPFLCGCNYRLTVGFKTPFVRAFLQQKVGASKILKQSAFTFRTETKVSGNNKDANERGRWHRISGSRGCGTIRSNGGKVKRREKYRSRKVLLWRATRRLN